MIRPATEQDVDAMSRVLHESLMHAAETIGGYPRSHLQTRALDVDRNRIVSMLDEADTAYVVAIDDASSMIVGFAAWTVHHQDAELRLLYVDHESQGNGVGSVLLDEVKHRLGQQNIGTVRLTTMIWNLPSRRFYENRGFELTGNTKTITFWGSQDESGSEITYDIVEYEAKLR